MIARKNNNKRNELINCVPAELKQILIDYMNDADYESFRSSVEEEIKEYIRLGPKPDKFVCGIAINYDRPQE